MTKLQLRRRRSTILLFFVIASAFVFPPILMAQTIPDAVTQAAQEMGQLAGEPVEMVRSRVTGMATFVTTTPGRPIPVRGPSLARPEGRALAFLDSHGAAFGLRDSSHVRVTRVQSADETGVDHIRLQQVHNGVPVTGGEMTVHLREAAVVAVLAKTLPGLEDMNTTPSLSPEVARLTAQSLLAKSLGVTDAVLTEPRLEIFNRGILEGTPFPTRLAWFIEATRIGLREFIWVDAHTGSILLHFSQLTNFLSREVYDAGSTSTLPGTQVRTEGGPATGDIDADKAYEYAGDAYNYFFSEHGRDSYDTAGATIISTVHYCENASHCPYIFAGWNGAEIAYGDGYSRADDVVAHEFTHAVTQYSAHLFYYMQSGALNESFSDIFGETVDLTNGRGTDTDSVRWLLGEDVPGTCAKRNMMDPTAKGHPGKMSDPEYYCGGSNTEVLHSNNGVPNHAYALMVDGGSYNGFTVTGIGLTKAAKIQYRALTEILSSASDFLDNYNALKAACTFLIGTAGITASDCAEVTKALDAVEMSSSAPCLPSYGVTQITNTTGGGNYNPSINADGTRMAFRSDRDLIGAGAFSHLEVFLWTSGSGFTKISNTAANSYSYPSINADGTRFAFTANPNAFGTYLEIVLWTSGSGVTHIAYSNGPDDGSVWSWYPSPINADGTKITFASMHDPIGGNADGNDELFLWTSGLGLTQLTNTTTGGSNGSPSINADGTRIAFASTSDLTGGNPDGNAELFLWTQGAVPPITQLTNTTTGGSNGSPSINADGTRIAFASTSDLTGGNPDGNSEIFLASADPTPDPFTLTDVTGVPLSTVQTSNAITVSGITAPAAISIVDGAYELNNSGTWSSSAGTVTNGNTVRVRHTSAATSCTAVNTILTIGDVSDTFTSTTTIGYPLAITKLGSGSGTVTSNPAGIDCGATCAANYTSGIPVTLTATSNPDSTFVGWGGDCGGQGNPCSLTMTSSKTVSATFTAIPPPPPGTYTLTVSPPSNGTVTGSGINCPGDCSEPYSNGTNVILTANPNPDYSFGGWGGNCGGQGNPCTLTMNAAKNVTATFTATPPPPPGTYILTVSPPANGTVTGTSGINCPGTCSATRTAAART